VYLYPYVFIKPSDEQLYGTVKYVPEEKINVSVGDEITFRTEMEYQFQIEDEKLYKRRNID